MISQIADCAQAESLRFAAAHDERVGIVEPERFGNPDAEFRQSVANFIKR